MVWRKQLGVALVSLLACAALMPGNTMADERAGDFGESLAAGSGVGSMSFVGPSRWTYQWNVVIELASTGDEGRVAVVVNNTLYPDVAAAIATYAADLSQAGYPVIVATYDGEIGDAGAAEELRDRFLALWDPYDYTALAGAVLIGKIPYVIVETVPGYTPGVPRAEYPADTFYADMDGTWLDLETESPYEEGAYDTLWGDRKLEIWVSRIRVDNLVDTSCGGSMVAGPFPGYSEADLVNTYFARNHVLRWDVFNPHHDALVYLDINTDICDALTGNMEQVYGEGRVTKVCEPDETTKTDYIENRLTADYQFIHECSHGNPVTHFFHEPGGAGYVDADDYTGADSSAIGFTLKSCHLCDFAFTNPTNCYLGGVIVFNPEASALIGYGGTTITGPSTMARFWTKLANGESIGEAYKREFYLHPSIPMDYLRGRCGQVLLGDGSLKRWRDCNQNGLNDYDELADSAVPDCNGNNVPDECDIAAGTSVDCDANGIPDECEAYCRGDMNCDGVVDFDDIDPFVAAIGCLGGDPNCWDPNCPWLNGDLTDDCDVTFDDIDPFNARLGTTCP